MEILPISKYIEDINGNLTTLVNSINYYNDSNFVIGVDETEIKIAPFKFIYPFNTIASNIPSSYSPSKDISYLILIIMDNGSTVTNLSEITGSDLQKAYNVGIPIFCYLITDTSFFMTTKIISCISNTCIFELETTNNKLTITVTSTGAISIEYDQDQQPT